MVPNLHRGHGDDRTKFRQTLSYLVAIPDLIVAHLLSGFLQQSNGPL